MAHAPAHNAHHTVRYYLVLGTILVGGIFALLLLNEDTEGLTGSVAGFPSIEKAGEAAVEELEPGEGLGATAESAVAVKKAAAVADIEHSLDLTMQQIPDLEQEELFADEIIVTFSDPSAVIKIDKEEELNLRNLDEVTLSIHNFLGDLSLEGSLTLVGDAERLEVNGVVLSTEKSFAITLTNLDFDSVALDGTSFDISFTSAHGEAHLENKLDYTFAGEDATVAGFVGDATFTTGEEISSHLQGGMDSLVLSGDGLALEIKG